MSNSHKKQSTKEPSKELTEESAKEQKQSQTELDETAAIGDNQNSVPLKKLNLQETEEDENMKQKSKKLLIVFSLIAIGAGAATGVGTFKIYHQSQAETGTGTQPGQQLQQVADEAVKKGDVFGVQNEQVFKDSAEGYLEKGGLDGEGSHKLLRPGGSSQTVYLTSSVTDLDKLVGMQVKVWGETFKGQKAGWLMDVGKVEVLDPQAKPPQGEQL